MKKPTPIKVHPEAPGNHLTYVVAQGYPMNLRFTNSEHKTALVVTVSVVHGKLKVEHHQEPI
jgi:hypothetical protein